jgi:CheY-like chemotaxis protein
MPRILIVEDDAAIREMLARRLSMAGYETVSAEDGVRALLHRCRLHPI